MRFGLPDNYSVVLPEVPVPAALRHQVVPAPLMEKLNVVTPTPVTEFHRQLQQLEEGTQPRGPLPEAEIESLEQEFHSIMKLQLQTISESTAQALQRQRQNTQAVIKLEQQRLEAEEKRRQEEEKRRREEAEKRRKEEEQRRKQEEERKRREAEEQKRKAEEERKRQEAQKEVEKKQEEERQRQLASQLKCITNFTSIDQEFKKYKKDIADIKTQVVQTVTNDQVLKKQVGAYKRKLNVKFGQLLDLKQHLTTIGQEVIGILKQTQSHPAAYKFILNFVAKAIISQAETEVGIKLERAQPLAHMAYILLKQFPEFEYFLTARFVKKCPYIIGYSCLIDTEEGRYRMNWKRTEGTWEDAVKYEERVGGIAAVWAVMSWLTEYGEQMSIYLFKSQWQFLARMLNTSQLILDSTHFAVVSSWWEVAASHFLPQYGRQSAKLLQAVALAWPMSVSQKHYLGAARLLIAGEEWEKLGQIKGIKPMNP